MLGGVVLTGGALVLGVSLRPEVCGDTVHPIDEVWNPETRELVRRAAERSSAAFAGPAALGLERALDDHRARWIEARHSSCIAARVDRVLTEAEHTATVRCLARDEDRMRTVVDALARGDAETFAGADGLVDALGSPTDCIGVQPTTSEASAESSESAERARADALFVLGRVQRTAADIHTARATLRNAVGFAEAHHADVLAAQCWCELVALAVEDLDDVDIAREWLARSEAATQRAGSPPQLVACHADATGMLALAEGSAEAAIEAHEHAIASWVADPDAHVGNTARSARLKAFALVTAGRAELAVSSYRELVAAATERLGAAHPDVAVLHIDLALALASIGDVDEARRYAAEGTAAIERVFGHNSRRYARALTLRSEVELQLDDAAAAIASATVAAALQLELELAPARRTEALLVLTNAHIAVGDLASALAVHMRLATELAGTDDRVRAHTEQNIGEILCMLGRCGEARPHFEWVLRRARPDSLALVYAHNGLAKVDLDAGAEHDAEVRLRGALESMRIHGHEDPELQAEVRWNLARALVHDPRSGPERRTLARAARAYYETPPVRPEIVAELQRIEADATARAD